MYKVDGEHVRSLQEAPPEFKKFRICIRYSGCEKVVEVNFVGFCAECQGACVCMNQCPFQIICLKKTYSQPTLFKLAEKKRKTNKSVFTQPVKTDFW